METAIQLMLIAALSGEPATAIKLDGDSIRGELAALNPAQVSLSTDSGDVDVATDQLMLLQFDRSSESSIDSTASTTLVDGSRFSFDEIVSESTTAKVKSKQFGELSVDLKDVAAIRWAAIDEKIRESWSELQTRGARDDLLVIRKGDVLDYVGGTVTQITAQAITVSVRGRDLKAPTDKVFGVIFANRKKIEKSPLGKITLVAGDELNAVSLDLKEEQIVFRTETISETKIDLGAIREIDFGGGRIKFLAELPFDDSASVSPNNEFPVVWFTARNFPAGTGGRRPLKIDGIEYSRGLWIHSGGVVRFRLNRQFSELRATAGFDQTYVNNMSRFDPKVRLSITGDEKELFAQDFVWNDPSVDVQVDLSGVRELVIRVEPLGKFKGILEHFALGDAQVIK